MALCERKQTKFIGGVAVLTVSTAVVKLIGFFYKLPLIMIVGMDGMGYFLAAYHIYTMLLMLSSAGLPTAVSILVSKSLAKGDSFKAERAFTCAVLLFSSIGGVCAIILYALAPFISSAIGIPESDHCIRAIAPSLLFAAAGSAVKGYFQGHQDMKPTAISQIIESAAKLVFGLLFTAFAKRRGAALDVLASCAIGGLTFGSFASSAYLFFIKLLKRTENADGNASDAPKRREIVASLISVALPISLISVVMGLTGMMDTALIPTRLQHAGFSSGVANLMYSGYGNLCVPVFGLVPSFISPIAVSMIPMISDAASRNERERERELLNSAFRLCTLIAIPSAVGISVFSNEILGLIFYGEASSVALASPLLSCLAPAILFSCLITLTNATLQSYGKTALPIVSMLIGVTLKLALEYVLVGLPAVNIIGAPLSTVACDLTVVTLNLYFIKKHTGNSLSVRHVMAFPLLSSSFAVLLSVCTGALIMKMFGQTRFNVLLLVAVTVCAYVIFSLKTKLVSSEDIMMIPNGDRILRLLRAARLIK